MSSHGINYRLVLRKLKLGSDYASDFFYLSKSSDDWNCVFIELEKTWSRFFKDMSNELHGDFLHAIEQIGWWRGWLTANKTHFENHTVGFLRKPLFDNPCFFKYVLVHGRRSEYEGNATRRGLIQAQERDDFKIITYDSLLDNPHDGRLYIAARDNEGISILSDEFVTDNLFAYVDATQIEVSAALHGELSKKENWFSRDISLNAFHLERALPRLRMRK